jgi:hypothetical protein
MQLQMLRSESFAWGADRYPSASGSQREHHLFQTAATTSTIRPSYDLFLLDLANGRPYDLMRPVCSMRPACSLAKCIYRRPALLPKWPARDFGPASSSPCSCSYIPTLFPCHAIRAKQPFARVALAQLSAVLFHGILCMYSIADQLRRLLHTPLLDNQSLASTHQR